MGRDFRKLEIWRLAFDFVVELYPLFDSVPSVEDKNLISQARRAATSLPLNIAEGCSMRSNKVFLHFLNVAYGSAKELEVILLLLERLYGCNESASAIMKGYEIYYDFKRKHQDIKCCPYELAIHNLELEKYRWSDLIIIRKV